MEGDTKSRVIIKIAGEQDVFLSPINGFEEAAFNSYIDEIRYAGVQVTVINYLPDRLYLDMKIYRDPLVIDVNGNSILYGGKPVETAIKEFMKELPFNGEFIIANLVDKLQKVEGVKIPHMNFTKSSWIDAVVGDYGLPQPIDVKAIPVSGYYQVVNFDSISYVV